MFSKIRQIKQLKQIPLPVIIRRSAILAICISAICYVWFKLFETGIRYEWHWNRAWRSLGRFTEHGFQPGPLLDGILITIIITFSGLIFSTILGVILSLMRLSVWPVCKKFAQIYILVLRNTPLLLELFFVYFLISPLLYLGPSGSAILALTAFESAYCAELFRAAILSVPRTQWEAGLSLGFNLRQCFFYVILPQAVRNGLPSFTNQAISLLKDTSLVSAIAVADITMRAQAIVAETFLAFEIWLIAGFIYLLLALCMALPELWLEKHQKWR